MACITKEEFDKYFTTIDKEATKKILEARLHRKPKFSIWDISSSAIITLISDIAQGKPFEEGAVLTNDQATNVRMKAAFNLGTEYSALDLEFATYFLDETTIKEDLITMKHVVDSITSELAKADSNGIDVTEIINPDTKTVNTPLARLATVIGREIAYSQGIAAKENSKLTKEDAAKREMLYYKMGLEAIERMERKGLVKIEEEGKVINDFYSKDTRAEVKVNTMKSVSLVIPKEAVNTKENPDALEDFYKAITEGFAATEESKMYNSLKGFFNPLSRLVRETLVTFPPKEKPSPKELKKGDYMEVTDLNKLFRDIMEDVDLKLDTSFENMLIRLAKAYEVHLEMPFITFLNKADVSFTDNMALTLGLKKGVKANNISVKGQNLSKLSPIESIVNMLIDYKLEHGVYPENIKWFPTYAFVRNARLHDVNSFLNPQLDTTIRGATRVGNKVQIEKGSTASKIMAEGIEEILGLAEQVDEKDVYNFYGVFTQKIANTLKDRKTPKGDDISDYAASWVKLLIAIRQGEGRMSEEDLLQTIAMAINSGSVKGVKKPTEVYKAISGLADIIMSKDKPYLETDFVVEPDATSSGFSLMVLQKLNSSNPEQREALVALAKGLGIFKNDTGEEKVRDPYQLAEKGLEKLYNYNPNAEEQEGGTVDDIITRMQNKFSQREENIEDKHDKVKALVDSGIFKNLRELAKIPTVSLIYSQSKSGARNSISIDIADALIEALVNNKADSKEFKAAEGYLKTLLPDVVDGFTALQDSGLKAKLIKKLKNKGEVPEILYEVIEKEAKSKYFETFDSETKTMFDIAKTVSTEFNIPLKILPALTAMEFSGTRRKTDFKDLMKYGIPLMKRNNVIEEVTDDKGNTYQVMRVEEVPLFTTFGTLTTHSTDEAILAKATIATKKRVGKDFNMYGIQDAVIANPKVAAIFQEEYIKATKDVLLQYDTKEELVRSIELMIKEVEKRKLDSNQKARIDNLKEHVVRLKKETEEGKKQKQALIEAMFDEDSTYLFGFDKHTTQHKTKNKKVNNAKSKSGLSKWIEKLKDESELIRRVGFEGLLPEFKVDPNMLEDAKYDPTTDTIYVKDEKFLNKEVIEHEITHAIISGYINERATHTNFEETEGVDINLSHIKNALDLVAKLMSSDSRMQHIKSYSKTQDQINEFITYYMSDKEFRDIVNTNLLKHTKKTNKKRLGSKLVSYLFNLVKRLSVVLKNFTKGEFKSYEKSKGYNKYITFKNSKGETVFNLSPDLVAKSISTTINKGFKTRKESKTSQGSVMYKGKDKNIASAEEVYKDDPNAYTPETGRADDKIYEKTITQANEIVRSVIVGKAEGLTIKGLKLVHNKLSRAFPLYATAFDKVTGLVEENTVLQKVLHYTNIHKLADPKTKNELISLYQNILGESNTMINQGIVNMERAMHGMSDKERKLVDSVVRLVPLTGYYSLPINARNKPIQQAIDLYNNDFTTQEWHLLDEIAEVIVNKKVGKNLVYNTYETFESKQSQAEEVVSLLAVKKLAAKEKVDPQEILDVLEHKQLKHILRDNALALKTYSDSVHRRGHKDNTMIYAHQTLTKTILRNKVETEIVTPESLNSSAFSEENGWKILRKPTGSTIGIVYRYVIDDTTTNSIGTDMRYNQKDVYVPQFIAEKYFEHLQDNNVVAINRRSKEDTKFKIVLTEEEEKTLGAITDAKDILIRSTQHMSMAYDTEVIRDRLLEKSLTMQIDSKLSPEISRLVNMIKAPDVDHPYFIRLGKDLHYEDLPKEIKQKYMIKPKQLSNIGAFNTKIDLVRKDISYWLLGERQDSIFKSEKLRVVSRVVKNILSSAKLGLVIANARKIAGDMTANANYLATMGVPMTKIAQYGKRIVTEMGTMNQVQLDLILAKYRYNIAKHSNSFTTADVKRAEREFLKAKKAFDNHPMSNAIRNGFIHSISSDVINNEHAETISGLQADIEDTLGKLLLDKDGKPNKAARGIMKLANMGYGLENIYGAFAKMAGNFESLKIVEERFTNAMEQIAEYKKEDDVISYVQQFILSPKSEIVKTGIMLNDVSDIVSKEIYYRHLRDTGMSHKDAVNEVIQSFPDYKEEMPIEIKVLSNYGILMFPAYWMRIQKVIYNMIKSRLISFGVGEVAFNAMGIEPAAIFGSNIISKSQILNNPFELIGVNAVFPTRVVPY